MNENILELHELDELKAAYNQIDERLDGQEIVSDENLREAMYNKFADIRRNIKESLVWLNLVLVPLFLWKDWYENSLTLFGIIVMAVYWVASLLFRFFILRKTKKEDYGTYDLKTLTEKEARYQKNINWATIIFVLFWVTYFLQYVWVDVKKGIAFYAMILVILIPVVVRYLIIKYKYNGEAIDPATGKDRVLMAKWFKIILFTFAGILMSLALFGFFYNLTVGKSLCDLLSTLNLLPLFITFVALALAILHIKKKMTVPSKLLYTLIIIALFISVAIIGIAYFMNFSTLCNPGFLFSVALSSYMALTFHRMRKS
jgi:hypothetical protein